MVFVSLFSSEKNQLQIGKKWKKCRKKIFNNFFAKKIQSEKKIDFAFILKRSLHRPCKIDETMNAMFGFRS